MSPSRTPPGDAINRCRDAVDAIQSATSHKFSRDRAEFVHLLGSPHIQVSHMSNIIFVLHSSVRLQHSDFSHRPHEALGTKLRRTKLLITHELWNEDKNVKMIYYFFYSTRVYLFCFNILRPSCSSKHFREVLVVFSDGKSSADRKIKRGPFLLWILDTDCSQALKLSL